MPSRPSHPVSPVVAPIRAAEAILRAGPSTGISTAHVRLCLLLARLAAVYAGMFGVFGAVGAALEIEWLRGRIVQGIAMKFNTGLCLACAAAALYFLTTARRSLLARWLPSILAGVCCAIGLMTMVEHATGQNLGIDTLFVNEVLSDRGTAAPGRMGVLGAMCATLAGLALFAQNARRRPRISPQAIAYAMLAVVSPPILGFMYGEDVVFIIPHLSVIAAPTAIAWASIALGLFLIVPRRWPLEILLRADASGDMVRRTLPAIVGLPLLLGWMHVMGEAGLVSGRAISTSLLVTMLILSLSAFLWRTAAYVGVAHRSKSAMFTGALDPVAVTDERTIVVDWNPAAERIFGLARGYAIGRPLAELLLAPPEQPAATRAWSALALSPHPDETPAPLHVELTARDASGRSFPLEFTLVSTPLGAENGEALLTAFMRDVSRQKDAENARRLLGAIVNSSDDPIVSKNLDGIITSWNRAAERLYGWTSAEVIGRSVTIIIPDELLHEEVHILEQIRAGEAITHYETRRVAKDGRSIDVSLTISPIRDESGRIVGASKIARDISDRRRADAELRRYRENLEALVADRTMALEQSQARLRSSERAAALGNLASGLGHDLSNLLLPVRARLESAARSPLPAETRDDIKAAADALGHAQRLATGLRLIATDPERASATTATNDLASWWTDVRPVLRTILPRGTTLEASIPNGIGVSMTRHHLTQIVFNLVQNAGEAIGERSDATGRIVITAAPEDDRTVRITVRDNGPGMSPDVMLHCMEPYFSTKGRAIATGMGLPMVRGLTERAGGSISVDSTPGSGTVFTVRLPTLISPAALPAPSRRAAVIWCPRPTDRTSSVAQVLLQSLGFDVVANGQSHTADLAIAIDADQSQIDSFLGQAPHRRVVVCDVAPNGPGAAMADDPTRAMFIGRQPRTADLRRAIVDAAGLMPPQAAPNA